jgi:hypothetical protein
MDLFPFSLIRVIGSSKKTMSASIYMQEGRSNLLMQYNIIDGVQVQQYSAAVLSDLTSFNFSSSNSARDITVRSFSLSVCR